MRRDRRAQPPITWTWRFPLLPLVAVLALALTAAACTTSPSNPGGPSQNPDLAVQCGFDVNVVVDRSGSIGAEMGSVTSAVQGMVDGLEGTGSRVRFVSFSDSATGHASGDAQGSSAISDLGWSDVEDYEAPALTADGGTNWEDALEMVRRATGPTGELTVVLTDGNPNLHNAVTGNGHGTPHANLGYELSEAISEANGLKAAGSHILAVGVGAVNASNLVAVSGPDLYGAPGVSVVKADYMLLAQLSELPRALADYAKDLCDSSLTIHSWLDTGKGLEPAPPWEFVLTAEPAPLEWTQPRGLGPSVTVVTDKSATATAVWQPSAPTNSVTVDTPLLTEASLSEVRCLESSSGSEVAVDILGKASFRISMEADDRVACDVVHRSAR